MSNLSFKSFTNLSLLMVSNQIKKSKRLLLLLITLLILSPIKDSLSKAESNRCEKAVHVPGADGSLYDIFKKRLEEINKELSYEGYKSIRQETAQPTYYKRTKNQIEHNNFLMDKIKQQLEAFNKDLSYDINRTTQRKVNDAIRVAGNVPQPNEDDEKKRSSINECLYEEYKKRLDKINNDLAWDGEKVFDRSGRHDLPTNKEKLCQTSTTALMKSKSNKDQNIVETKKEKDFAIVKDSNNLKHRRGRDRSQFLNFMQNYYEHYYKEPVKCTSSLKRNPLMITLPRINVRRRHIQDDNLPHIAENVPLQYTEVLPTFLMPPLGQKGLTFVREADTYPNVLTKAFETVMDPVANAAPGNLLGKVATKLNTTTLELAKKLANMQNLGELNANKIKVDPNLNRVIDKYIANNVIATLSHKNNNMPATNGIKTTVAETKKTVNAPKAREDKGLADKSKEKIKSSAASAVNQFRAAAFGEQVKALETVAPKLAKFASPSSLELHEDTCGDCEDNRYEDHSSSTSSAQIASMLEKVLNKLENLQNEKEPKKEEKIKPDGAPCDLIGSWNSYLMGLKFEISVPEKAERNNSYAEKNNTLLCIGVEESLIPKHHDIITTDWNFMGSALRTLGGPFYLYTQRRSDNTIATFVGFCRICGEIDTIFGSWTFLHPSKDCQDITTSVETKRDILRRNGMDAKRKAHLMEFLYRKSKYAKKCKMRRTQCSP